jgi:hypothetical protein
MLASKRQFKTVSHLPDPVTLTTTACACLGGLQVKATGVFVRRHALTDDAAAAGAYWAYLLRIHVLASAISA